MENEEEKNGKLHYVDDLEYRLNKPKTKPKEVYVHKINNIENLEIKNLWKEEPNEDDSKKGNSFGVKFLIFSVVIFICAMAYVGYLFSSAKNMPSNSNINLSTNIKPYVDGGEVSKIEIVVENKNKVVLKNAVLSISYNKGISSEAETSKIFEKKDMGDLGVDSASKQDFDVQFYGKESEVKNLVVNLEYHLDGSNGSYNKQIEATTIIKKSPVEVRIEGLSSVNSGQAVNYDFVIKNNLQKTMEPFVVKVYLPKAFKTESTKDGSVFFNIDKLGVGEKITKSVSGYFEGINGEKNSIHVEAGVPSNNNSKNISIVYFSTLVDVEIKDSELKLNISAATDRGNANILRFGDKVTFVVNYENLSTEVLNDVEMVVKIKGEAPDINGIIILDDGYFDSTNRTITINSANKNSLKSLSPQSKGYFSFQIPIVSKGINTPRLSVEVNGNAFNVDKKEIVSSVIKEYLVQGSVSLSAFTAYRDSTFRNTGPVPPVVDTETTYTLHLNAFTQNELEETRLSFILPIYTKWIGTTNINNNITYNKNNRTVTWDIGHINATTTVSGDVNVSVKPSLSHLGSSPDITGGIVFTGNEIESKARISVSVRPLTTELKNEEWGINTGNVVGK